MSFALWHQIELAPVSAPPGLVPPGLGLPLTVSNDVLGGSLVIDADVDVTMAEDAAAGTFEITLMNLPTLVVEAIKDTHAGLGVTATVRLGYFDDPSTRDDNGQVMTGRVMAVSGSVGEDGLSRTTLYGQEEAGYLLRTTPARLDRPTVAPALTVAQALLAPLGIRLADGSTLDGQLAGFTVREGSLLGALGALAARSGAPLVIRDRRVFLGRAVGAPTDPAPVVFHPDTNLISLTSSTAEDTEAWPPVVRTTVDVMALGHPGLRAGQMARIAGLSGVPEGPLRISRVMHHFRAAAGYTTELQLIVAGPGERARVARGAQAVADRWLAALNRGREDHPAVDVGEVSEYTAGEHHATLAYGQSAAGSVVAPSVQSPVDTGVKLNDKPIASPFAFHHTGLMTPVYPGMRAVLAHNGGRVSDAIITGFVWPDNPARPRPANEEGDYWLALPTGLGDDGLPRGPGANDLTDRHGRRIVQVAALHIVVGTDALPEVGARPVPPDDDTVTIEHHSGTTIAVDPKGAVTIRTANQPITLTNGTVSMKLDGSSVAVT